MSLINQMLQDLEQRRAQVATPNGSPLAGLAPSGTVTRTRASLNTLLLGAVLVLVPLTAYLIWTQRSAPPVVVSVPVGPEPVDSAVVVTPAAPAISVPATVAEPRPVPPESQAVAAAPVVVPAAVAKAAVEKTVIEKNVVGKNAAVKKPAVAAVPDVTPEEVQEAPVMEKRERPLTPEQRAQQAFQQAVALLGRGRQADAFAVLAEALEHDPNHLRARETLAALQLNTGRLSEAEATLHDGLTLDPAAAPLAKLHARILMERGDTTAAIAVLEPALPNAQTDADYLALLAALLARDSRHAEAVQGYEMLLRLRPDAGPWWMGLALSLEALGNTAQALPAYERARSSGLNGKVAAYVDGRIQALRAAAPAAVEK